MFLLPNDFVSKLKSIRADYEKIKGLTLKKAPQPYRISCFFGATDVNSRDMQITLIEDWLQVLHPFLSVSEEKRENLEQVYQNYLIAVRILVAVCHYVRSQTSTSATLRRLINEAIGLDSQYMDEETLACCLLEAKKYMSTVNSLTKSESPFTEPTWEKLLAYFETECEYIDNKDRRTYPITSITVPLMAKPLEGAGYVTGFMVGKAIGCSIQLAKPRQLLISAATAGILFVSPTSILGASIFAPMFATQFLINYCGLSLAWLLGTIGNILGSGLGYSVGFSVDLSYYFLKEACTVTVQFVRNLYYPERVSGLSLINGAQVYNGFTFKFGEIKDTDQANDIKIEIREDEVLVTVNGETTSLPLPDLDELKASFSKIEEENVPLLTL